MINVLVAFNSDQVNDFLDNFRADAEGNLLRTDFAPFGDLDPYDENDLMVIPSSQGGWKENSNTTIVTMEVGNVAMIAYLRSHYHGRFQVLGAWNEDGGLHEAYPLHPQYLRWMPDDVTHDDEGNVISRTPATEFKQVNTLHGQPDRRM
jgi:hypothetical protein